MIHKAKNEWRNGFEVSKTIFHKLLFLRSFSLIIFKYF